jgi:hypothetical protein
LLLSYLYLCFTQSGFWVLFFSCVCWKPGAKLCGCHTVFHLNIHASQIPLFFINLFKKNYRFITWDLIWLDFWCFNATFSNISAISCRPVLVVEEAGVPGENHRPRASNWQLYLVLSYLYLCFTQSGFWVLFFSCVCWKPGAKLCGCHTVFHLNIHASYTNISEFKINLILSRRSRRHDFNCQHKKKPIR